MKLAISYEHKRTDLNTKLWNSVSDDDAPERKQVRDQKRRLKYISNILVVSDPKHPENEGKVFLFTYGKKIFDKITLAMNPEFEGDAPLNPFDLWKGANFRIRIRTVDGYPNYNESSWEAASPIKGSDDDLEKLWNSEYSLKEFIDPKHFKSYADLERKLHEVLGIDDDPFLRDAPKPVRETPKAAKPAPKPVVEDEDDDPDLADFRRLAE